MLYSQRFPKICYFSINATGLSYISLLQASHMQYIGTCFCNQFYHMVIPGVDSGGVHRLAPPLKQVNERKEREKDREGNSSSPRAGCRFCGNSSSNVFLKLFLTVISISKI